MVQSTSPPGNSAAQCNTCHPDIYTKWATSVHANTQADVAGELSQSDLGMTPAGVIQTEDCVACHAPTAVQVNGGMMQGNTGMMTDSQALGYFFTTTDGQFSGSTAATNTTLWPHVVCTACHAVPTNHVSAPGTGLPSLASFDSRTGTYASMTNASQLCGQCHGTLRFGEISKVCDVSFNIVSGIGGMGVTNQQTMPGVLCTDCHMYSADVDGSNSKNFHGHSWAITVQEPDGTSTTSCTHCHGAIDTLTANAIIDAWKSEFQSLDATASANVAQAAAAVQGAQNTNWFASLQEAQYNLALAEADGSGGFHNHKYAMALLNDANTKVLALPILTAAVQGTNVVISWTAAGLLQSAGSLAGPWQDMTNATSPLTLDPATQMQQQFHRLRP